MYDYKKADKPKKHAPEPIVEPTFEELYTTLQEKSKVASSNDKQLQFRYKMWDEIKDLEKQISDVELGLTFHDEMEDKFDQTKTKIIDG